MPDGYAQTAIRDDGAMAKRRCKPAHCEGEIVAGRVTPDRLRFYERPWRGSPPPSLLIAASAACSPLSQAPPTVPQSASWTASPANQRRSPSGCESAFRAHCPPGEAKENAPRIQGSLLHRVAWVRLSRLFSFEPKVASTQSMANAVIAASPSNARSAPNLPAISTT